MFKNKISAIRLAHSISKLCHQISRAM